MPCQLVEAGLEVALDVLIILVLVVELHNALEHLLGILQCANALCEVSTQVAGELELAISGKVLLHALGDACAELLLAIHLALAQNLVEELLVDLCRHEASDFRHLVAEV